MGNDTIDTQWSYNENLTACGGKHFVNQWLGEEWQSMHEEMNGLELLQFRAKPIYRHTIVTYREDCSFTTSEYSPMIVYEFLIISRPCPPFS